MAARKVSTQHSFAQKVSEILERLKIPEKRRDKLGNPFIEAKYLPRLPNTVKSSLEEKGLHRISIRPYKQ